MTRPIADRPVAAGPPTAIDRPDDPGPESASVTGAARGTAANLVGAVVGAVVSFVTVGVVTNTYGGAGAGLFFAATAAFTLAANGARLGAESSLTYFISRFRSDGREREIPGVIRTALLASGSVALVLAGAGLLVAPTLSGLLTSEPEARSAATTMLRILALAVPTFALSQAMFGASRGFATMRPAVLIGQVIRPTSQLLAVLAVIVLTDSVWPLALAWAASSALTMGSIGLWLARRIARVRRRVAGRADRHPVDGPSRSATVRGDYWRFTGPRALADLLSAMLERLDVLLVAVFVGEVGAGLYGAANRLILVGQLMMIAAAQSMAPLLSAQFGQGRDREAQRVLRTISGWNVTLLWPLFICLALWSEAALSVFGSEFAEASSLVVVLSLAFLVVTGLGIGDTLLTMTGDSVASLANHAIALAVMVAAAVTLLPTFGIIGAAWAWALSRIVLRALAVGRVWRTKRVNAIGPPVLLAAAAAAVAYGPTGVALRALLGTGPMAVAAHVGLGGAIHCGLLWRLRHHLELARLAAIVTMRSSLPERVRLAQSSQS